MKDANTLLVRDVYHYGDIRREIVEPLAVVRARLEVEAHHGATRDTLGARLANVRAALTELEDNGRSESWGWHTLTFADGAGE